MKKIYLLGVFLTAAFTTNAQVVISQIFPAGGNTGATIKDDYLELYNMGASSQSLNGWYVQYASATGPSATNNPTQKWIGVAFPNGLTIGSQKYFLVKLSVGTNGTSLSAFDADFSSTSNTALPTSGNGITMSATAGKIAIINALPELTGIQDPAAPGYVRPANLVDLVGYGSTANGFENEQTTGVGPAPIMANNTSAIFRVNNAGSVVDFDVFDNNDNSANFISAATKPRSAGYLSIREFDNIPGLRVSPNPATTELNILSDSFAAKTVEMYDVLGKVALKATVTSQPLNISGLAKGVYVAKITEEGKVATRKVVVE